jgi:hypothetical protein
MSDKIRKGRIDLLLDQIPEVRGSMLVMKLDTPTLAPEKLIRDTVQVGAPEAEFKKISKSEARVAYHKKRLVALVHPTSGESNVIPTLGMLKPGIGLAERAKVVASEVALESALFPKDGTEAVALAPLPLLGAKHQRGEKGTKPSEYISYVRFQRRVNGVPVFGPGTRATIGVAANGSICALTHRWRKAIPEDKKMVARSKAEIHKAIIEKLTPMAMGADVRVDKVMICYYDGGQSYLQPVYRYEATVKPHTSDQKDRKFRVANYHVQGYIPIGTEREPIVHRLKSMQNPPMPTKSKVARVAPPDGDPTVGRYIIRNAGDVFWTTSWDFINNLQAGGNQIGVQFTDSQYFWEDDFEYLSNKNDFVNGVNIAYTACHGNWWKICLDIDPWKCLSPIDIGNTGGYGAGAGGALAYWIIHSCEVIPTQEDMPNSFDCWWSVFNGLHAVVGYRTEAFIDDGVFGPFGYQIGLGAAVVPAWLNVVISADCYQSNPMYCDGNRLICEPLGRPSVVVPEGHGDDAAWMTDPIGPATYLWEFWFPNIGNCHACKPPVDDDPNPC